MHKQNYSMASNIPFHVLQILALLLLMPCCRNILTLAAVGDGKWDLLVRNAGISAMHMQLLNTDRVVIFDYTNFGPSNISLPNGRCRRDPNNLRTKIDCTAHSVEYNVASNAIRPLMVQTDVFCSSGSLVPNGTLVQTGGFNDGDRNVRLYRPCDGKSCDWQEIKAGLIRRRWYATNHILPDGRQIIIGGRREFNFEFYPKIPGADKVYTLPFLQQTNDVPAENNLYPFVFLNVDGNLFIFANNRAILFDYVRRVVVRNYPTIPGGDPRTNPSTGSAVLLPLKTSQGGANIIAEVLVCGGAPKGAFASAGKGIFVRSLNTCGRIRITDLNPRWVMETMPMGRIMGDMLLLPNGDVLIINGAGSGMSGWEVGRNPVLNPVVYRPGNPIGSRFEVKKASSTPRMYHSTAILLRDGRILVAGSNAHAIYSFTRRFPTDLTMEAFSPSYLDSRFANLRPRIVSPISQSRIRYNQQLAIRFTIPPGRLNGTAVMVTMIPPSFNTHSFSMNQRLLILRAGNVMPIARSTYQVRVSTPSTGRVAPSGYYLLFVVHQDIPSVGIWVHIS